MKDKNKIEIKIGDTVGCVDNSFSGEVIELFEDTIIVTSDGDDYEVDAEDCIVIPDKTKVLITVSGGVVQSVDSNDPNLEYIVVDYDNIEQDDEKNTGLHVATTCGEISDKLYNVVNPNNGKYAKIVHDHLKEINF